MKEMKNNAAPAAVAVPDERAAFVNWLHGTYPHSYTIIQAADLWFHKHVAALAWQARAALAATQADHVADAGKMVAAPVRMPEPVAFALEWTFNGEERGMRLYDDETHCRFDAESDGGVCHPLYTEQQVRALLATATGLPAQAVDAVDPVQAAADAASVGHLLNLVDHQTALLARAMAAMKAVELTASPIDEPHGDLDARIPYEAWATFVDARAALLYDVKRSPVAAPQAQAPWNL